MNALNLSVNQQYPNKETIIIMAIRMRNQIVNLHNAVTVKSNAEQCSNWVVNVTLHHGVIAKVTPSISKL